MPDDTVEEVKASPPPLPPIEELTAEDVIAKVYDVTNDDMTEAPRCVKEIGGVPNMGTLRDELPPGSYLVVLRARKGNTLGRKTGTLVRNGIGLYVPGERPEAAESPAPSAHRGRVPITGQGSSKAAEQSAVSALVDLVRELSIGKQAESGGGSPVLDALDIVERLQALTVAKSGEPSDDVGHELAKERLTTMFDEGLNLGKRIGEAMAAGNVSNGDSKGNGILSILERVLAHPTVKDALARASAPVVNLDEFTAATSQEEKDNG